MYPAHWLSLYPAVPRDNRVFVAMSFDPRFDKRWSRVIEPALSLVEIAPGEPLLPYRVDARTVGDSILTEIVEGIAQSRLVFVDITTIGLIGGVSARNGNVMYELGIAQATRMPEEVLIFRSDDDMLPFDTTGFRTNSYDPDGNEAAAVDAVRKAAADCLREIDLRRAATTRRVAERLGADDVEVLVKTVGGIRHRTARNAFDQTWVARERDSIQRLLDYGLISTLLPQTTPSSVASWEVQFVDTVIYVITAFGLAVLRYLWEKMGVAVANYEEFLAQLNPHAATDASSSSA